MNTKRLLLAMGSAMFLGSAADNLHARESEKPNFVLILADDLGYGDVSYQGGNCPTPNIDSIARNGVIFTDGYVTCPVCAPSRAALLSGRYQQRFGFWDNIGPYRAAPDIKPGIPPSLPIMSERLKKLGYVSGFFGKSHDGKDEAMMPFSRWDEFYGFNNGASCYLGDMNSESNPIFHNRQIVSRSYRKRGIDHKQVCVNGVIIKDIENYLTDKLGEMAVKFIERNKHRPFLCYVPFNAIHGPFQAPKSLYDKYAYIKDSKRRRVMAMLESLDQNVGRILNCLKKNKLMEKTLIVFLSDNGGHEASPNTPLRGKKGTFWEGGLRVPFCMQWTGHIKPGMVYRYPVSSLDILPTFIEAAGGQVKPEWKLDGVSLLPFLTGQKSGRPHQTLYWIWSGGRNRAIRHGDFKAVTTDNGSHWHLYDLAHDISEQHDLASQYPERLKAMIHKHELWRKTIKPPLWGWNKKLGYRDPSFKKPVHYNLSPQKAK